MARFTISGRSTIAGTSTLPNVSLYATAAVRPAIVEIGIWNTTSTAAVYAVNRLTTAGTQGAGLTEVPDDVPEATAVATGFAGHTVAPTLGGEIKRADLQGNSGVIWTWSETHPLVIPDGTGNGIGIIVPTGTGQVIDYSISWLE
jgi:hypothetical protein